MKKIVCLVILQLLYLFNVSKASPHYLQDPTEDTDHVEKENALYRTTKKLLNADSLSTSCSSCMSALQLLQSLSYTSEPLYVKTLANVCVRTKRIAPKICHGLMEEQAPITRKVVRTMDVEGREGRLFCASVMNSCPYPEVEPWNVTFPKEKPTNPKQFTSAGETMTVLHLSDWHVDPNYQENADAICNEPICCRTSSTDYSNITKAASKWGEYTCDPPVALVDSMLKYIPTVEANISFGIMTGDLPPHEIWSTLPFMKTKEIQDNAYALLHTHFDAKDKINTILYPAVGNHEAAPTNIFPLHTSDLPLDEQHDYLTLNWLYKSLAKQWNGWLSSKSDLLKQTDTASYVTRPMEGLKIISLNTNFCYNLNWWLYERPADHDPNGVLAWLVDQLQESEDLGERAWIIGHIPPGDSTCFHDYSNYYYQIIERYAPHVIAGQFFGHTHQDEMEIFYRGGQQEASEAISVAYIAPSITPYYHNNPSFRMYKVDKNTFEVVDSMTFMANLDQASNWTEGPNWHLEYSAKEAYSSSTVPVNETSSLTAEWWHNVTNDMETNDEMFEKYWRYRRRLSPKSRECDGHCRSNAICNIRAGKSELRCDYHGSDVSMRRTDLGAQFSEPSSCGWNLLGIDSLD